MIFLFAQWGISPQLFYHDCTCSPTPTCITMWRVGFVQTGCRHWFYALSLPHIFTSYCVLKIDIFHYTMSSVSSPWVDAWTVIVPFFSWDRYIALVSWRWLQSTVAGSSHTLLVVWPLAKQLGLTRGDCQLVHVSPGAPSILCTHSQWWIVASLKHIYIYILIDIYTTYI